MTHDQMFAARVCQAARVASRSASGLGELERAVMECVWSSPSSVTVRDVVAMLDRTPTPAYNTVMTVLDRLARKRAVDRERDGRAYRYRASIPRAAFEADRMTAVLDEASDRPAVLMQFAESISAADREELAAVIAGLGRTRRRRS